jgi:hypothetical protein
MRFAIREGGKTVGAGVVTKITLARPPRPRSSPPQRATVMNGSFLRASLFTSVLSFGVCLFAIGVGVTLLVIGWALNKVGSQKVAATGAVAETPQPDRSRRRGGVRERRRPTFVCAPEGLSAGPS